MIGSFLGAGIADLLSGQHLQLLIGVFAVVMAYRMFKGAHVVVDPTRQLPSTPMQFMAGGGIGIASAIFGIGGGSLTVPYLNRHGVVMQKQLRPLLLVVYLLLLQVQLVLCGLVLKSTFLYLIRLDISISTLLLVLVS